MCLRNNMLLLKLSVHEQIIAEQPVSTFKTNNITITAFSENIYLYFLFSSMWKNCTKQTNMMQTNPVQIRTLDCAWNHQYDRSPFHRCCLSYRRTVKKSASPFLLAASLASLGFHLLSSPLTLIPQRSESAMPQQRDSSWQHRPVVPWLDDMNRLQTLTKNSTVEVIKEIQSPNIRVQSDTRLPWLVSDSVCHIAKVPYIKVSW